MIVAQYPNSMYSDMASRRRRKYKSPATGAAEEAVDHLEPPVLPEYLRGDDGDGPSGSEEENDANEEEPPWTPWIPHQPQAM